MEGYLSLYSLEDYGKFWMLEGEAVYVSMYAFVQEK